MNDDETIGILIELIRTERTVDAWADKLANWGDVQKVEELLDLLKASVNERTDPSNKSWAVKKTEDIENMCSLVLKRLEEKRKLKKLA